MNVTTLFICSREIATSGIAYSESWTTRFIGVRSNKGIEPLSCLPQLWPVTRCIDRSYSKAIISLTSKSRERQIDGQQRTFYKGKKSISSSSLG